MEMQEVVVRRCECGCGAEVATGSRFIRGHHVRVNNPMHTYVDETGRPTFYVPDFLIENGTVKTLAEVKGWMRASVVTKAKAAIEYCKAQGYKYVLLLGKQRTLVESLSSVG